jgi:hypothetical protein
MKSESKYTVAVSLPFACLCDKTVLRVRDVHACIRHCTRNTLVCIMTCTSSSSSSTVTSIFTNENESIKGLHLASPRSLSQHLSAAAKP